MESAGLVRRIGAKSQGKCYEAPNLKVEVAVKTLVGFVLFVSSFALAGDSSPEFDKKLSDLETRVQQLEESSRQRSCTGTLHTTTCIVTTKLTCEYSGPGPKGDSLKAGAEFVIPQSEIRWLLGYTLRERQHCDIFLGGSTEIRHDKPMKFAFATASECEAQEKLLKVYEACK